MFSLENLLQIPLCNNLTANPCIQHQEVMIKVSNLFSFPGFFIFHQFAFFYFAPLLVILIIVMEHVNCPVLYLFKSRKSTKEYVFMILYRVWNDCMFKQHKCFSYNSEKFKNWFALVIGLFCSACVGFVLSNFSSRIG